ncbi:MAG: hypothetical protein ACE5ID_09050 [Acidobacteriota bacterium]
MRQLRKLVRRGWILPLVLGLAPSQASPFAQSAALALSPEQVLPPIFSRLSRISTVYRQAVLRFSCREVIAQERIHIDSGAPRAVQEAAYNYLLQSSPGQAQVTEYRRVESRNGIPVRPSPAVVQTFIPPPFLWATLFDALNAPLFNFQILGRERHGLIETIVIGFEGLKIHDQGYGLAEWSGRIWIDRDRLNPVKVEAEPARQAIRLKLELDRFRRAFRIAGIPLRSRPRAYRLSVDFLVSRFGLSFPSTTTWRRQVVDLQGERHTEQTLRRQFSDYRFFDIQTDEIVQALKEISGSNGSPAD